MISELYDYQREGIERLKASLRSDSRRPMVMAPTGAGKTKIGAAIVEAGRVKTNRGLFVVPAISLIDQTAASFFDEGLRGIGVIQAQHPMTDPDAPIQIASVQTLMKRKLPDVDFAIIDEAHRWFKFYEEWFTREDWAKRPIIGLSATPWAKGLGQWYDDLIIVATTAELIERGRLAPFRVFAPSHPDLSKVHIVAGDYHEGELSRAMQDGELVADIIRTWIERGEDRPTFCFAVDRAHAKALQERFLAAGVPAGYMDAFTPLEERAVIKAEFHKGEIKVVCNVGVLTTGIDWDVRCLILARPTKSEMLFVQIIGRGLRTAEGKADCLILDHSDNHVRLGFVTDIHHPELDGGKKTQASPPAPKEPLPKECPRCHFLRPPRVALCPSCGFKAEPVSKTKESDGRLIELKRDPKHVALDLENKRAWYGQLNAIGLERGYAPGWAANQFREKFSQWPAREWSKHEYEPTPEVRSWVRSRMIRYAKGKAKGRAA